MSWTAPTQSSPVTDAISVSVLLRLAKTALERALPLCWVTGEVSGFKRATSGHCYFDLKDDVAQIACVLYRNRAALVGFELKDGAQVELRVRPSLYEPRGSLQFAVEQARLAGVGRLYEAFLRLKAKLEAEGVFAGERKRELPAFPKRIGLITSTKAAALADMLRVLRDRWPRAQVVLYPASVQGANAPGELCSALAAANARRECEVLIIGRGGGSVEDLWAFNDEALTRAVAASTIPIVSAVGHETDVTLCDFAADVRAPTPTAAASLVTPERTAMIGLVENLMTRSTQAVQLRLDRLGERLDRSGERLRSTHTALAPWRESLLRLNSRLIQTMAAAVPARQAVLASLRQRLALHLQRPLPGKTSVEACERLLHRSFSDAMGARTTRLSRAGHALELLNPSRVLDRGYAMVLDLDGAPVTQADAVPVGSSLHIRVQHGSLDALVTGTRVEIPPSS